MHIKRLLILVLVVLFVFCCNSNVVFAAKNTHNPEDTIIKSTGKCLKDFVPKDWKLISKVQGD